MSLIFTVLFKTRGEDDIVELLCQSGQIVRSNQTQRPTSDLPVLRGSGSGGGGGENASHQNIFIQEDEMASWLEHPLSASSTTQPVSLAPLPPSAPYYTPLERPLTQISGTSRAENLINFTRLRQNILMGHGPWNPTLRESAEVGSSATPSSSTMQSGGTLMSRVSQTFAVGKEKAVAVETVCEIAGTSSSGVCKAETEPIEIQPETGTDDNKRKERQETVVDIEGSKEARGSTSRKRSRAAEMHNISERRRREKINEKMKALQELIPRCNKTDKASMLDDAIEYVKSLQMQIDMMSSGSGMMPMMYTPNMQQFMPQMAMGMPDMNRPPFMPFPGTAFHRPAAHMGGLGPSYPAPQSPFPNIQASDPSRVHLLSQQPYQPQFPGYMNPYSQFAGLHQMEQPPPLQNPTTAQLSFNQASSSKEHGDQHNQPTHTSMNQGMTRGFS